MRTTIDLPDDLFRQAKVRAASDGISLKSLITRWIRQGLAESVVERTAPRRRSELPVLRPAGGRRLPIRSNADLYRILDDEDLNE